MMYRLVLQQLNKKSMMLWGLLLIFLLVSEIILTVLIPLMREYLFNGIELKDQVLFIKGITYFVVILIGFGLCQGFKWYVGHRVGLIVRTSLTNVLEKAWYDKGSVNVDNPDQRISEDSRLATEMGIEVLIEMIVSFSIVVSLIFQMSGNVVLLGAAFCYVMVVIFLTYVFHRPMVNAEKMLQRGEADFRIKLASITLGSKDINTTLQFKNVITKYLYFTKVLMGFTAFNNIQSSVMSVVPFLLLVPLFFIGEITLGGVMKGVAQFDLIVLNAAILTYVYPRFTKSWASFERINEFYKRC